MGGSGSRRDKSIPSTNQSGPLQTKMQRAGVAGDRDGIGYASLSEMGTTVKALSIGGVACNEDNVKNGTYGIARPFAFVVRQGMKTA